MKRFFCIGLACLLIIGTLSPSLVAAAENSYTRVINVVYDDSGSMYTDYNGTLYDTWCQAKYAMEVFAAMLGPNDTMNVYYMSDYEDYNTLEFIRGNPPRLVLFGSDSVRDNIAKIHNETTITLDTPFTSVEQAYEDLTHSDADEKWLVVLTDGVFGRTREKNMPAADIDAFFAAKDPDISIMFLSMGEQAAGISQNEKINVFYMQARNSSDILSKLTDACTRIYNSNKLSVNVNDRTISFDIPMAQLTVFAQGQNVRINSISSEDGTVFHSTEEPVEVRYSECLDQDKFIGPHTNLPVTELRGSIAVFDGDFQEGTYTINVAGAETLEVYYKPNIDIAAYLIDGEGNDATGEGHLAPGEYELDFGFVRAGTREPIQQSGLLGNVSYEAVVSRNGIPDEQSYTSGDSISLEEGAVTIDVIASYLDYNTVRMSLDYPVFTDKGLTLSVIDSPEFNLDFSGITSDSPILLQVLLDGEMLTEEQWNIMPLPEIELAESAEEKLSLSVEKSDEIGIYNVFPVANNDIPKEGIVDCEYTARIYFDTGSGVWSGETIGTIQLNDIRDWGRLVEFTVLDDRSVIVNTDELTGSVCVSMSVEGRELTDEEWEQISVPRIRILKNDGALDHIQIEKTDEKGVFELTPMLPSLGTSADTYASCEYELMIDQPMGPEQWKGEYTGTIRFDDARPWWERNRNLVIKCAIALFILIIILGYMPFIKHYLPRSLKRAPLIKCRPNMSVGKKPDEQKGRFEKNMFSVIVPYMSVRGRIKYVPGGAYGFPALQVHGIKGRRMKVVNYKALRGKKNITFDGFSVKEDDKKLEIGASVQIKAVAESWTYICVPSQGK